MSDYSVKIDAESEDEVAVVIAGTRVEQFWNETITLTLDSVGGGFSFNAPFFPNTEAYRELFRPFQYQSIQIYIGGNIVLNGTIELIIPNYNGSASFVTVQGRSKTGILIDCTFEQDDFNGFKYLENGLQFNKADLEEIASSIVEKFEIETEFPDGPGAIFERVAPKSPTTKIFDFLHELARQRSLLMGQTAEGKLLFRKAKTEGEPVAELIEGQQGVLLSQAEYDSTKRFSEINVFGQEYNKNDNFALIEDSSIPVLRPKSISANETNAGNIVQAGEWSLSSDYSKSITIPLSYEGWLKPGGGLWQENELITIQAPSIMIYNPSTMLIKSVTFKGSPSDRITDFALTIPESYTGEIPEVFPWD
jgi:prophage tail gpP-like protein